jgi:hypothetical protein
MKPPMAGWIGFASTVLLIIGGITAFEGLIAIIRDEYYVVTGSGVLLFDITTWGWIMVVWGIVLLGVGFALSAGAGWARWVTVVIVSVNVLGQLSFAGSFPYPLWGLTVIALSIVVLYALIARWEGYPQEMGRIP